MVLHLGGKNITGADVYGVAQPRKRYSWMPDGWFQTATPGGGSRFLTIAIPDDFYAVRVGFANISTTTYGISKIIACASSSYNDYFNPKDAAGNLRPSAAWSTLTSAFAGVDDPRIVTASGAPTALTIGANATDASSGETANAAFTWTDWVPCASVGADPTTGMRVLMLRTLVPASQTLTFANGTFSGWLDTPSINYGYDHFIGAVGSNVDKVTNPATTQSDGTTRPILISNRQENGSLIAIVQVMTKNGAIVGMTTGDSHHQGTSTTSAFNNYLVQSLLPLGQLNIGKKPIGLVNCAVGGMTSQQFTPRLTALLSAVRPSFVVLPGWTYNDLNGSVNADIVAENTFFARLLSMADQVKAVGAVPVFLTPFPRNAAAMTPTVLGPWQSLYNSIMAMAAAGEIVVDATTPLANVVSGVFDGTYKTGLSTDNVHPNDLGHGTIAAAMTPQIRRLASI